MFEFVASIEIVAVKSGLMVTTEYNPISRRLVFGPKPLLSVYSCVVNTAYADLYKVEKQSFQHGSNTSEVHTLMYGVYAVSL